MIKKIDIAILKKKPKLTITMFTKEKTIEDWARRHVLALLHNYNEHILFIPF